MNKQRKIFNLAVCSALVMAMHSPALAAGQSQEDLLLQMQKLIEDQRARLDRQDNEIAQLKEQMAALAGKTEDNTEKITKVESLKLDKVVTSSSSKVNVDLYGQVNRAFLWADDGNSSRGYFVDNNNSSTRWGLKARGKVNDDVSLGGWLEGEMITNNSRSINQLERNPDATDWYKSRHLEFDIASKRFGTLWLGKGFTASDGTSQNDLSGTTVAGYSDIVAVGGGYYFYDNKTGLSTVTVNSVFNDMDGLSRRDRIRYDSPDVAGFSLSTSAMSDAYDAAINYNREFPGFKVKSALAWAKPGDFISSVDNQYNGSLAILLNCGFNVAVSAGVRDQVADTRDDATFWYTKLGYSMDLFDAGKTSFAADYGEYYDIAMDDDTSTTFSLAAVQAVKELGTEFYLSYRLYKLERDTTDFEDINLVLTGARIKF
ncbi:MAG: porin [Proteobacteria bacterium]|nr:porin [Pseudomonadota bacterium]MBU1417354.1 porin [Pseudomonadota bacterium]MBU1455307.1 porin [Pseudomonadota bacterium]